MVSHSGTRPVGLDRQPAGLAARQCAVDVVGRILSAGVPHDEAMRGSIDGLEPRDVRLVTAIVLAFFRCKGEIDDALDSLLEQPLPVRSGPTRLILQCALAQLMVVGLPPHAVIDSAVALSRHHGQAKHFSGLVNAVLRNWERKGRHELTPAEAARVNTPAWAWRRWWDVYGPEVASRMAMAHAGEPPLDVTVKDQTVDWARELNGKALPNGSIRLGVDHVPVHELPGFAEGQWWVQDVAASLPARLLGDVRGLRIADFCAAPGGKTLQLAAAGAMVTAMDKSAARLTRLKQNLGRTRLTADVVAVDVTDLGGIEPFHGVLLDAPCSATGTARRHPELLHIKNEAQVVRLATVQGRMLRAAAKVVKPGGVLVYCTCSLEPEEGERQIGAFLAEEPGFQLFPMVAGEAGVEPHMIDGPGYLRTLPHMTFGPAHGMDGFFAARLRRVS